MGEISLRDMKLIPCGISEIFSINRKCEGTKPSVSINCGQFVNCPYDGTDIFSKIVIDISYLSADGDNTFSVLPNNVGSIHESTAPIQYIPFFDFRAIRELPLR